MSNKKQEIFENTSEIPINQHIGKTIEENQQAYSDLVITGRAIPSMYDGLKPVHRRIYTSFYKSKNIGKNIKSARIVGECLTKGTLISTPKGFKNIEDINIGDYVNTQNGIELVTKLFHQPEQEIIKISLEGNVFENKSTLNHKYKILNKKCEYSFKEVSKMKIDDYLILKPSLCDVNSNYSNEECYVLGLLLSDGNIDRNKNKNLNYLNFSNNDINPLIRVNSFFNNKFNIRKKNTNTYVLKISNKKISHNFINKFNLENKYSYNIHLINDILNKFSKKNIESFLSGYIDCDGYIDKKNNRIIISSIDKSFLKYISKLIFDRYGIYSSLVLNNYKKSKKNKILGKLINQNFNCYNLIFSGMDAYELKKIINLSNINKKNRLLKINKINNPIFSQILPYFGKKIFKLFKEKHLGGGWYKDENGNKFRLGIKYIKDLENNINLYSNNINDLNIMNKLKKLDKDLYNKINQIIENKIRFIKIINISKVESEITYDFTVKNKHEFIANGIMSSNCIGKFHPHGDMAVYGTIVDMTQVFKNRFPFTKGQGNWGNIEGDSHGASRYTEVKLPEDKSSLLFENIEKDNVVTWIPNFDDTIEEPRLLPVKYPISLLNGTSGIAYGGITTKIPSFNIQELTKLYIYLIENKFWTDDFNLNDHKENLLEIIPGVDLPTGTNIYFDDDNKQEDMLFSSNYTFRMRASYKINENDNTIELTNIPVDTNTTRIVEEIRNAGLSYRIDKQNSKKQIQKIDDFEILNIKENADVKTISSYGDINYKNDAKITVSFKKNVDLNVELVKLFKYTSLDSSFSVKMNFIDANSCPISLSLIEQTFEFLKFRLHVFYNSFLYDINKLSKQLHILYGMKIILNNIDTFIEIVKETEDELLYSKIKNHFDLDDIQIEYLLNMQLRKISKTNINKIINDINEKELNLNSLKEKISTKEKLYNEIKKDYQLLATKQIISNSKNKRLSKIIEAKKDISKADLIKDKEVILMYMDDDTIGYVDKKDYRVKKRGTKTKNNDINDDFDLNLKLTETLYLKDDILLMTDKGRVFKIPVYQFSNQFKVINNFINLDKTEKIISMVKYDLSYGYYSITTKNGKIKGFNIDLIKNTTGNRGIKTISLEENDKVISFFPYKNIENEKMIIVTTDGKVLKFDSNQIKVLQSGNTKGVKAIKLNDKEFILKSMIFIENDKSILIGISDIGKGKKTFTKNIKTKKRAQSPNIFFNNSKENGKIIGSEVILDEFKEGLLILTEKANISMIEINNFNSVSKTAKGAINLLNLDNEKIKICKKININSNEL